jgi:threonine synthase
MKSYLSHLECTACGDTFPADELHRTCPSCGKVLYARYDLVAASRALAPADLESRTGDMWRYFELLPVRDAANVVSLGEGFTPLLPAARLRDRLGCSNLLIKDEGVNPTSSFKARGLSAAVSRAVELGVTAFTIPSAGNAGGALAAYAARAGAEAHVFMPTDVPRANRDEVDISGAHVTLVDGLISDAGKASRAAAEKLGLFDVSTLQEPYRAEGKKTMGYEIAEQLEWKLPDAIVYPAGGGTGIVGIWKAFQEMERLGWLDAKWPRMFCVQAEGCAPLVRAFREGADHAEPWVDAQTIAAGLRVPAAIGDYLVLAALRESGGGAMTVTDEEIMTWVREVAILEGLFMCPEGAATAAALEKLLADGTVSSEDTVLLLNTGSGLKNLDLL